MNFKVGAQQLLGRAPVFFLILSNQKDTKVSWQARCGQKFFSCKLIFLENTSPAEILTVLLLHRFISTKKSDRDITSERMIFFDNAWRNLSIN